MEAAPTENYGSKAMGPKKTWKNLVGLIGAIALQGVGPMPSSTPSIAWQAAVIGASHLGALGSEVKMVVDNISGEIRAQMPQQVHPLCLFRARRAPALCQQAGPRHCPYPLP